MIAEASQDQHWHTHEGTVQLIAILTCVAIVTIAFIVVVGWYMDRRRKEERSERIAQSGIDEPRA